MSIFQFNTTLSISNSFGYACDGNLQVLNILMHWSITQAGHQMMWQLTKGAEVLQNFNKMGLGTCTF